MIQVSILYTPSNQVRSKKDFETLVKDYKLYYLDKNKKSVLLDEIFDNQLSFRSHVFDPVKAFGIKLEILSTHGLDRAQVFKSEYTLEFLSKYSPCIVDFHHSYFAYESSRSSFSVVCF